MITTVTSLEAIENIQPGDMVLVANEETSEVAYKEVVRTFVNTTDEITRVTVNVGDGELETIDSTPEHPFYVEGKGWVEASSLHAGMTIWFANGNKGTVEDISNEGLEEPVTVYNFEVKDFHTYFVGENGVLVHNTCPNKNGRNGGEDHQRVSKEVQDDLKGKNIEWETESYVPANEHTTKGSRYADVAELDSHGDPVVYHQVGKTTQAGNPVARERRAIEDIVSRTKLPVVFHSYNDSSLTPLKFVYTEEGVKQVWEDS